MITSIATLRYDEHGKESLSIDDFKMGCFMVSPKNYIIFNNPKDMREHILNFAKNSILKKKRPFIYVYDGTLDFYSIFKDNILKNIDKGIIKPIRFNNLLCKIYDTGRICELKSFYNMNLSNIEEILGFNLSEKPKTFNNELCEAYLAAKCETIIKAINIIKTNLNLIGFRPRKLVTAGQLAITTFRTFCNQQKYPYIIMVKGKVHKPRYPDLTRKALRGGRIMAFRQGYFEDAYYYDQNSQHPYIQTIMDFPNLLSETLIRNPAHIPRATGVSKVIIESPSFVELPFAYLPITYKGRSIYPHSCEMTSTWTNLELEKAVSLGYKVKKIFYSVIYKNSEINPLKDFQEKLYNLKMISKDDLRIVVKMLMNNLAFKFSQVNKDKTYKIINRNELINHVKQGYDFQGVMGEYYIMKKDIKDTSTSYYNPIISVLVTALSRHIIYEKMEQIGHHNVLYCNTDGIMTLGNFNNFFKLSDKLGDWKINQKSQSCNILGENRYQIGNKIAISGVSKDMQSVGMLKGDSIEMKRVLGFDSSIRNLNMDNIGNIECFNYKLSEEFKANFDYPDFIEDT